MNKVRRKQIEKLASELEDILQKLQEITDEEENYYDNIPENLQTSEMYDKAGEYLGYLQDSCSSLEGITNDLSIVYNQE